MRRTLLNTVLAYNLSDIEIASVLLTPNEQVDKKALVAASRVVEGPNNVCSCGRRSTVGELTCCGRLAPIQPLEYAQAQADETRAPLSQQTRARASQYRAFRLA